MTFKIIGEMIEFEGRPVAVIRRDIPASVRADITEALEEYTPGNPPDDWGEPCPECEERQERIDAVRAERDAARAERDAYAAMLGIPKCA